MNHYPKYIFKAALILAMILHQLPSFAIEFEDITYGQIVNHKLSGAPINGNNNDDNLIPTGTIIVYKTKECRYGKMQIQEYIPVIVCDKIKMKEVFLNLVNNAIKFSTKNNKKRPCIEIGYRDKDEWHEFYVKDNGIGIDKKDHDKIFEIFQKVHDPSEYSGTGAGLSIVKRIIEDHGGRIRVHESSPQGTTMSFELPLTVPAE